MGIQDFIDQNKQVLGNAVNNILTTTIQDQLTQQGVVLTANKTPEAKQGATAGAVEAGINNPNMKYFLIVGGIVGAVILFKVLKKGKRV